MLPSSVELQYFVEVAGTLNISRAAERLGISQPTLSLAIQRLEGSIGSPLLVRTKSGVQLTQTGQRFAVQARSLLYEWEKIRGDILKDEARISGRYVIGCHSSVALFTLPHFLPRLLEENPGLEIKLTHDLSRRVTEEVISFKTDFGIVVNPAEHPDLVIKLLCKDEVSLWTAKKPGPTQDGRSGQGVLICEPDLLQTQALLKDITRLGLKFPRVVTSPSLEVVTALVAEGMGVGILPSRVATRIKAQGLQPLGKDSPKYQDRICLVYRADAQKSVASRAIARAIEKAIGP